LFTPFQARGEVHAVADGGVVEAVGRAQVADHRRARVHADAHADLRQPLRPQLLAQLRDVLLHLARRPQRMRRLLRVLDRRAEHGHHGVADEAVHGAVVALHDGGGAGEVQVEDLRDVLGLHLLGERRESLEVGEEHGDLAPLAAELQALRIRHHVVHHLGRHVEREGLAELGLAAALGEEGDAAVRQRRW
jgi:hypothetical protein